MIALAETVRRLGYANSAVFYLARAMRRLTGGRVRVRRYHFVAQPVPAQPRPMKAGAIAIGVVGPADPIVAQFPRSAGKIARRFADGAVCLAAQQAGRFVGYLWLQFGAYDEDEVRCRYVPRPPATTAWDFDVYVDPAFRNGRTFARLWEAANALLRERGVQWTVSRISAFNAESLRAHAHFGVRHLRTVTFLRLGSAQVMVSRGAPWLHVSLTARSRPTLHLDAPASGADLEA